MAVTRLCKVSSNIRKINYLYLLVLFMFNICVNSFMQIKLLYLDDLNTWREFSQMTFWQMIFNTSANKFRPVYYLVLKLCYKLFLPNVYLFGVFTLLLNFCIITLIFYVIYKITQRPLIAFWGSVIYTISRFAYYSISQVHGIMEQMALGAAVMILFLLWRYIEQNDVKCFWWACVFLFAIPFIHERYMVLYPLFILTLILAPKAIKFEKIKCFLLSAGAFVIPFLIRLFVLKNRAFDGTGGTDMKETFEIKDFLRHFKSGLFYLLGQNSGPTYLNGIEQGAVESWVKTLNSAFIMTIFLVICIYVFFLFKNKANKADVVRQLKLTIFIAAFIVVTLACSCATIRLEMRWIYTPYVAFILLLSNMLSYIDTNMKPLFCPVVLLSTLSIVIPTESYFRSHYRNIYYWGYYQLYNSMYDQTLSRYKDALWAKKIVVASEHFGVFGENAEALKNSLSMIETSKTLNVEMFDSVNKVPIDYYNDDDTVILTVDTYNQKMINLKDVK